MFPFLEVLIACFDVVLSFLRALFFPRALFFLLCIYSYLSNEVPVSQSVVPCVPCLESMGKRKSVDLFEWQSPRCTIPVNLEDPPAEATNSQVGTYVRMIAQVNPVRGNAACPLFGLAVSQRSWTDADNLRLVEVDLSKLGRRWRESRPSQRLALLASIQWTMGAHHTPCPDASRVASTSSHKPSARIICPQHHGRLVCWVHWPRRLS